MHNGRSLTWSVIGRNKRCVVADLRTPEGQDIAFGLACQADIIIENFRPGTLERFNLAPERVMAKNPGAIFVRVSGYGQDGPYAQRAGYGSIGEAMGGLRYLTGDPDRPPSRVGVSIGDLLAGMRGAFGALLALRGRSHTGRGQVVDVSIYESVLAMTESLVADYAVAGVTRERTGTVLPGIAPSNVYPTADGEDVLIAANQDTVFRRLAVAMGRRELGTSSKFGTHIARGQRQQELDTLITEWSRTHHTQELLDYLSAHGVPAGRLYRARDMLDDPHYQARSSIVTVPDPVIGPVPMPAAAPRLSETPGRVRHSGRDLGADTDTVLSEWLK